MMLDKLWKYKIHKNALSYGTMKTRLTSNENIAGHITWFSHSPRYCVNNLYFKIIKKDIQMIQIYNSIEFVG